MASATFLKPATFAPTTKLGRMLPASPSFKLNRAPVSSVVVNTLCMIPLSLLSTSSKVQVRRAEFCAISRPETATPPQLLALPGAYQTVFSTPRARVASKTSMASCVQPWDAGSAAPCGLPRGYADVPCWSLQRQSGHLLRRVPWLPPRRLRFGWQRARQYQPASRATKGACLDRNELETNPI